MSFYTLITGASTGIGRRLAEEFARMGDNLVLVARSQDKLDTLAAELRRSCDIEAQVCCQDLAEAGAASKVFGFCEERGLAIDKLVNCAGFSIAGNFERMDEEAFVQMASVNMVAVAALIRRFLPAMRARRRGAVVNIASLAGFQGVPGMACYSASKAFVVNLTEALSIELQGTGVRIFAVCPGFLDNDLFYSRAGHDRSRIVTPVSSPEVVVKAVRTGLAGKQMLIMPTVLDRLMIFSQRFAPRKIVVLLADIFAGARERGGE
ncbi:SDR family NAD(P)-dependent oxidoreductase [Chlorobaculum sp. MV4-Y]|uniref:SDR family NAD(P)-dependent oxidoreductase n=1 Tax=Chlorobaculum sp. MV4-Y TaxID=2976335 RepID=UPI0021AE82D0|nr:SDR family NAD(P)-dependent oxidoreductase [Chlorobaculum sp. MV4-Y]UWX57785.1 SDR family NAD(P)-dependent oxidoreductase [Chlorobaculum sp. MV4-Y]